MKKYLIVTVIFIGTAFNGITQNVGIGTSTPSATLDVVGSGKFSGNVTVRNKGLIYNTEGSSPLQYYTHPVSFSVALAAFGTSAEASINFSGFNSPPKVTVGDIVDVQSPFPDPLFYRAQLVIYEVKTSGCLCRVINTGNTAINADITWNIICIGE